MKNINKYIALIALGSVLMFSSCETLELDITENPNFLDPSQADIDFFLNSIQEDFVRNLEGDADFDPNDNWQSGGNFNPDGFNNYGAYLTRGLNMSGRDYASAFQAGDLDDEWFNSYIGILADIRAMTPLAQESGLTRHIGISQFIEAYIMTTLVDFFGDVPYTEAIQGAANLNPAVDSGASIYDAALALLDSAIGNFNNTTTADPANEAYYNNNYTQWVRAANTLKMKLYVQRRLVDGSAAASFNAIVSSGNYIQSSTDDFQYSWPATSNTGPDNRHPSYGRNYTAGGAGDYMSNGLMNRLISSNDPRLRYYFYRQVAAVPGQEIPGDEALLQCSLQLPPTHYVTGGFTFCNLPGGYWGRDHGDPAGIPPDGLLRSTFGVYPVAGKFDDDSFTAIAAGVGGAGAGVTPILTAFLVDLMKAEMALIGGDETGARGHLSNALSTQIANVQSMGPLDAGADMSFAPTAGDVSAFIAQIESDWDTADTAGKWDIFGEQYLVATYGMGQDAYNMYRRTGSPTTLQPNLEPNPGTFIRSMYYPSDAVNTNSNISQKADQTQPVFWDTNGVPPAN